MLDFRDNIIQAYEEAKISGITAKIKELIDDEIARETVLRSRADIKSLPLEFLR